MEMKVYQQAVRRTCATTEPVDTVKLMFMGMIGELGEIAEPVKKHLYSGHPLDKEHLTEEVGDFLWYLVTFCNVVGIDLEQAMQKNIEKLQERYPDGFSSERSLHRTI